MQKRKTLIIVLLVLILVLLLPGCSQEKVPADLDVDVDALANALISGISYEDQMSPLDDGAFQALYGIDPDGGLIDDFAVYASTGATAEEVAVLEAEEGADTDPLKELIEERIEAQKEGFENYVPAELEKLSDPVVVTKGRYVVMCLSNDNEKAKEIIGEYLK